MQCPKCQHDNVPSARFCQRCGQPLQFASAAPAQPPSYSAPATPSPQPGPAQPYQQPPPSAYPPSAMPSPQPAGQPSYPPIVPQSYGPPPPPATQPPPQGTGMANAWNSPAAQPYAPIASARQVRRISPRSAFKISAGIYGLIYGVIGLFGFIFSVIGVLFASDLLFFAGLPTRSGIAGILLALLFYILSTLLIALIAGVSGAISAFIYNVVAGRIGGLEVEVI